MIYFGENQEYILAECEMCKSEMYLEKSNIIEETAYLYRFAAPVKCVCGSIDEYASKSKKSCYSIRHELLALSDLLHKRQDVSEHINEINIEINRKVKSPSFPQIFIDDILFSLKIFLIVLAATLGVEIFIFIITCLMFFIGLVIQKPDLSKAGNELFYNLNIFKDRGGAILSKIGFPAEYPILKPELAEKELIVDYIPYALFGVFSIVFYILLTILAVRLIISVTRAGIYASKVVNQKYNLSQKKDEYNDELNDLMLKYQNLTDQINAQTIVTSDYKSTKAVDTILRYFLNNRVDNLREAVNLYHDEDVKMRALEYQRAIFSELRQTKRYAKALYILSSDENVKVDVQEEVPENEDGNMGEMLKNAFSRLKKSSTERIKEKSPPKELESRTSSNANAGAPQDSQDYDK